MMHPHDAAITTAAPNRTAKEQKFMLSLPRSSSNGTAKKKTFLQTAQPCPNLPRNIPKKICKNSFFPPLQNDIAAVGRKSTVESTFWGHRLCSNPTKRAVLL